jgi:hypothetical protein
MGQRNNNNTSTDKKYDSFLNQVHEDSQSNTHVGNDSIAFQLQSQSSSLMLNQSHANQNPLNNARMLEEAMKNKASRFGHNDALK